jgi:hypothetical protein
MPNSSRFQIYNTTTFANRQHFILIHSKIFSIIGILIIPIVLICLGGIYYFYKRYINTKFDQRIKTNDAVEIDEISSINRLDENGSSINSFIYFDEEDFEVGKPEQTIGL